MGVVKRGHQIDEFAGVRTPPRLVIASGLPDGSLVATGRRDRQKRVDCSTLASPLGAIGELAQSPRPSNAVE